MPRKWPIDLRRFYWSKQFQYLFGLLSLCLLFVLDANAAFSDGIGSSQVRFAHFSPDAPAYDVYVDGENLDVEPLDFGRVSDWNEFFPGVYRVSLVPTGATVVETLFGPTELVIEEGVWQTIALIGQLETGSLAAQLIAEDYSEIAAGETRLSFFQAVENAPPVDLYVNQNILLEFVGYPGQVPDADGSGNDGFVQVDVISGLYEMEIRENNVPENTVINYGEIELFTRQNTLLAMIGTVENPQLVRVNTNLTDEDDQGSVSGLGDGFGFLRFAHFSSGTPDVDIYIDSALSDIQQLSFSDVTPYTMVPAGTYTIDVAPVNTSLNDRVIGPLEINVPTGEAVTVAAIGALANDTLTAQTFVEEYDLVSSLRVGVSVFHAIPGLGPVDVIVNEQIRVGLLGFPGSQGGNDGLATFDLLRGVYNIQIVLSEAPDEVLAELSDIRLTADRYYLITLVVAEPSFLLTTTPLTQLTVGENE